VEVRRQCASGPGHGDLEERLGVCYRGEPISIRVGSGLCQDQTLLKHDKVVRGFERLCSLTTDVRLLYRPFVSAR